MTDRELLEAAAKAAGIALAWDARGAYEVVAGISGSGRVWNPLENDGDALRLAVKLDIWIHPGERHEIVEVIGMRALRKLAGEDRGAAVRRAIVMAAAAHVDHT